MPRSHPEVGRSLLPGSASASTVGRVTTRVGAAFVVAAVPLAIAAFYAILLDAPTVAAGVVTAGTAVSGPLATGSGVEWLLHVGVLGTLAGCWVLGAGLILSGLSD